MKRTVIEINEEKCIGCGLCASACDQGAIQMIDGKAKLVSDSYCDGLGKCLPKCPVDAIKLIEKETDGFDEARRNFARKPGEASSCGCPSSAPSSFGAKTVSLGLKPKKEDVQMDSMLRTWPVQIHLMSPNAPYLQGSELLIAADCVAYAYGNFHKEFINEKVTMIGCPKLDDLNAYIDKLSHIFALNDIKSVTVVRMSVPCCGGLPNGVKQALALSGKRIPYMEVTITPEGKIL